MRIQQLILSVLLTAVLGLVGHAAAWAQDTETPAEQPPVTPSAEDRDLNRQLENIYRSARGLDDVDVSVQAGIVTLSGEVMDDAALARAADLASDLEGVVDVQNQLEITADVTRRVVPALERLKERLFRFVVNLPLLAVGIAILVLAWWFANWLSNRRWLYSRIQHNPFLRDIAAQLTRLVIIIIAALLVLDLLGLTALVGAVLGAAGLATLAIGFAFRDLIENYIASILLSLRQPFEPDDLVEIENHCGRVTRLTSRATVLITPEGNHVRIPNATVFKSDMINYTRNPRRRFMFEVGVDVELALSPVQSLAERVLASIDGVMRDPAPFCLVRELGDSNVLLRVYGWVDQTEHDYSRVRSEAVRQLKEAFDDADIVMPEPIYNIKLLDRKTNAAQLQDKLESAGGAEVRVTTPAPETDADERPAGADTRSRDQIEPEVEKEKQEGQNLLSERAAKE